MQTQSDIIPIIGREKGAISASKIESVLFLDEEYPESLRVLDSAQNDERFCPLLTDLNKIKSILVLDNGQVYPSVYRVTTMSSKLERIGIQNITIIGRDKCIIPVHMIESIVQIGNEEGSHVDQNEGKKILTTAIEDGRYEPLVNDRSRIKSIVILSNGQVYPSTFNVSTLVKRSKSAK